MIYLTGQLLFFLLVTAFLGFIVGWLLRGAMLPLSMFEGNEYTYHTAETQAEKTNYQFVNQRSSAGTFVEAEPAESQPV